MRCEKCNKFLGLQIQGLQIKDCWVCNGCLEKLGFNKKEDAPVLKTCTYDIIKDGKEAYQERQKALMVDLFKEEIKQAAIASVSVRAKYASERPDVDATDEELKVFEILQEMVSPHELELKRTADSYVVAMIGLQQIARIKFSDRTAWVTFPLLSKNKNLLSDPEDIRDLARKVDASIVIYEEYN